MKSVKRMAAVFMAIGVLILLLLLCLSFVFWGMRASDLHRGTHLKTLAMAYRLYANDNEGVLPPVDDDYPLTGKMTLLYPKYVHSLDMLVSPLDKESAYLTSTDTSVRESFQRSSYMYLGVLLASTNQGTISLNAPPSLQDAIGESAHTYDRAGFGTDRFPILMERPRLYPGPWGLLICGITLPLSSPQLGGVVAYSNGDVDFVPYPGQWPMTESTLSVLDDIAGK